MTFLPGRARRHAARSSGRFVHAAAAVAVSFGLAAAASGQATLQVPGDHATIQAAIAAASNGDRVVEVPQDAPTIAAAYAIVPDGGSILVDDGVWSGSGNTDVEFFFSKDVLIASRNGPARCVIDGENLSSFLRIANDNDIRVEVRGFTLTRCRTALDVKGTTADISDCRFLDNSVNGASTGGAAVDVANFAIVSLRRCLLVGNSGPSGGAVRIKESQAVIDACTFLDNTATIGGSLRIQTAADVVMRNSILRGGSAPNGMELSIAAVGTVVTVSYCDVAGGQSGAQVLNATLEWGPGNIDAEPLFVDAAAGDLHLQAGSPCINTGDPASAPDADTSPADMGALSYDPWMDLGGGVPGSLGLPVLVAQGALLGDHAVTLTLSPVRSGTLVTLYLGLLPAGVPWKGGVFWPDPLLSVPGLTVPASGELQLTGRWPLGLPSSTDLYLQMWFADPLIPSGIAGSNGVKGTTP
jgi:hypothetical protein